MIRSCQVWICDDNLRVREGNIRLDKAIYGYRVYNIECYGFVHRIDLGEGVLDLGNGVYLVESTYGAKFMISKTKSYWNFLKGRISAFWKHLYNDPMLVVTWVDNVIPHWFYPTSVSFKLERKS